VRRWPVLIGWILTAAAGIAVAVSPGQLKTIEKIEGVKRVLPIMAETPTNSTSVPFLGTPNVWANSIGLPAGALGTGISIGVIDTGIDYTHANFGGPGLTGKIGAVTVWGVIIPVGFMSIGGWIWFSGDTFAAAWNPKGLSIGEGMGSSIALTLWAFLGMESASQNASAVENPKRDVPLACMFGTLGAAVVYVLSTLVIQGIVPNAELAESTGPFGLAYAKMFNPTIGSIVMALAVMACVGSLLGWQFTLATTAKDAADSKMFPAIFGKANSMGAPLAGMLIMGVLQTVMALSTISPNLSEQFAALVNLAVVTNVVPYIIALSALFVMMRKAGVDQRTWRRNSFVAVVAILYSVYALYASGKDAVMGGMLVMGVGYLVFGLMAPRFATAPAKA